MVAFTGALAAPPATYLTAAAANGTVASGPLKPVFLAFSTAAAAKIPGAELLKYCGDPSDYLLKFKNLNHVVDIYGALASVPASVKSDITERGGMVANCPIKAGDFDVEKSHKIPLFAAMMPKPNMPANIGEYFMRSKATLADGTVVACLTGDSKAFETAM
ncbi:hypothetical protein LTS12_026824 [Elasticomyces elasticus]|nr:hypothetical protein LTS12_026824 [Elasticomyces elasticus]